MNNAVEIRNLCKEYQGFSLRDISFAVPSGLCCGLVGPNGAGKTTTLKAIAGMVLPDSGEIRLLGRPGGGVPLREELGILLDQPYFQDEWTPLDIEKCIRPFYRNWDSSEYHRYLSRFELAPRKKFKNLSRGMKMKLGMAVLLSHRPRLLVLDEPTGGLDPAARDELLDILREYMVQEERTVLFSTHITGDLEHIADNIVYLSQGQVLFTGEKETLTSSYCVVRGGKLPGEKRENAIGLREHANGYDCLMALSHIGGLPSGTVTERASIEDVVVYTERSRKYEKTHQA